METIPCNLCGSKSYAPAYEKPDDKYHPDETFTVVECHDCGLGYVNPRPSFEEMGRYYPQSFYEYFDSDDDIVHEDRYAVEASYLEKTREEVPDPLLLDVGCAKGHFPRFMMKRGFRVEGVEPFSRAEINDFKVYRQAFDTLEGLENRYDVVTAWAVLEHVHDPMRYFEKAAEVLKPGGRFVFLVTNFKSLASRHLFGEDVPRHLFLFTEDTVDRYVRRVGMELEQADFDKNIYAMPPRGWLAYYVTRFLRRREFTFDDMPATYDEFVREIGGTRSTKTLLSFAARHPLSFMDRVTAPLVERLEVAFNRSGITTYVARKPLLS